MTKISFVWLNGVLVRVYSLQELREVLTQALHA